MEKDLTCVNLIKMCQLLLMLVPAHHLLEKTAIQTHDILTSLKLMLNNNHDML